MLEVRYDHEMLAYVDGIVEKSAEIVRAAAEMMAEYQGLTDQQFNALEATHHELCGWLTRYDKGYWIPEEAKAEMRVCEAGAADILKDGTVPRIVFVDEDQAA